MTGKSEKNIEVSGIMPPQNIEAEISVLGSILLDKEAIIKVADILTPRDFYKESHSVMYKTMLELYDRNDPIDLVTVSNKLESKKLMDKVGGASYLGNLANSVPSAAHVVNYAKIVSEKALLTRLIRAAGEIERLCYEEKEDVASILDKAEESIFKVAENNTKEGFTPIGSILETSFERIDELHKNKDKMRGVPTGFSALDNILSGLQNSDLIIVAGRPAMGKSSFALNIAQHVASKEGIPVAIFSLEMSKDQLGDRMLSSEAGVDSWKLRTGNLRDEDFPKIGEAMAVLSEAPIYLDDTASINVLEMKTKARRMQAEHGLGLIVIDYLQLMNGRGQENRVQEISEISRALKGLARELDIPVIALSQLSRALESRPSKIPQLQDLRESGSIEQDADVVIMIYREEYYDPDTERKSIADILVRKHRNGPVGSVELYWHPERIAFSNLDKQRKD